MCRFVLLREAFDTEFQAGFHELHRPMIQGVLNHCFVLFDLRRYRQVRLFVISSSSYQDRASRVDDVATGGRTFVDRIDRVEQQLTLSGETTLNVFLVLRAFHGGIFGDNTGTTARSVDETSIETTHVLRRQST